MQGAAGVLHLKVLGQSPAHRGPVGAAVPGGGAGSLMPWLVARVWQAAGSARMRLEREGTCAHTGAGDLRSFPGEEERGNPG